MKHTVLVTGASGGIGSAIARAFAEDGHRVAVHANRNRDAAERLCAALTERHLSAIPVSADLTDPETVQALVGAVRARCGAIDVLINNAGVALPQQLLTDCSERDWARVFDCNAGGMFRLTKAVLPDMVNRKRGSIVNISSMWGVTGGSCEAPYSASKAAVIGLTKSLAKELAPSGIRVNCVAPGWIDTPINAGLGEAARAQFAEETPLGRLGTPGDVADAVLFLALERASFITGQVLCVDGGVCI